MGVSTHPPSAFFKVIFHLKRTPEKAVSITPSFASLLNPANRASSASAPGRTCEGGGDQSYHVPPTLYLMGDLSPLAREMTSSVAQSCCA